MVHYFRNFATYSFPALIKHILLTIRRKEYVVTGKCKGCGQCCQRINLRWHKGWIQDEQEFEEFLKNSQDHDRFAIAGGDSQGNLQFDCTSYDPEYGCNDYARRPALCRRYPNRSLLLQGGKIVDGCGYQVETGVPFAKYLAAEVKKKKT